jgi:hypothetical protein
MEGQSNKYRKLALPTMKAALWVVPISLSAKNSLLLGFCGGNSMRLPCQFRRGYLTGSDGGFIV